MNIKFSREPHETDKHYYYCYYHPHREAKSVAQEVKTQFVSKLSKLITLPPSGPWDLWESSCSRSRTLSQPATTLFPLLRRIWRHNWLKVALFFHSPRTMPQNPFWPTFREVDKREQSWYPLGNFCHSWGPLFNKQVRQGSLGVPCGLPKVTKFTKWPSWDQNPGLSPASYTLFCFWCTEY